MTGPRELVGAEPVAELAIVGVHVDDGVHQSASS